MHPFSFVFNLTACFTACAAVIYLLFLLYVFVGVALASDVFMSSIEVGGWQHQGLQRQAGVEYSAGK